MTTISQADVLLGTTAAGHRVLVDVRFGPDNMGNADRNPTVTSAVTHEPIPHPDVLSITGALVDPKKRGDSRYLAVGQNVDDVRAITTPAGRLTADDLARFADLWDAWHLNAMSAGCVHMDDLPEPTDETLVADGWVQYGQPDRQGWRLANLVCPESGYRWGSAWLARPVPDEVIAEITDILERAQG